MSRYIAFAYESYYPGGGWTDVVDGVYPTIETAIAAAEAASAEERYEWLQVVDADTLRLVATNENSDHALIRRHPFAPMTDEEWAKYGPPDMPPERRNCSVCGGVVRFGPRIHATADETAAR